MLELALDRRTRETPSQRSKFARVRNAQAEYATKLRRIAATVGQIVRGYSGEDPVASAPELRLALTRYAGVVAQWARRAAASMLADVLRRDEAAWADVAKTMQRALRSEIRSAPTGEVMRELLEEQVALITSLPLEAAERVHSLALRGMETGARASELAKEILKTGDVTRSRAMLIARTETSRASSTLLQARAEHVGSTHYIWRSSMDANVRPLHRKLNGQTFAWTDPPVAGESGERAHAGAIYNCFPGDTLVNPNDRALRALRASYSGPLVVLRAGETVLEVTPNHPVLTPCGWIAAGLIEEGDDLVHVAIERRGSVKHDVNQGLRPIGEVFEFFSSHREACVAASEVDLYGDAVHDYVDVVRTDLDLPLVRQSDVSHSLDYERVAGADSRVLRQWIVGRLAEILEACRAGLLDVCEILLAGSTARYDLIGGGRITSRDLCALERSQDRGAGRPVLIGQRRRSSTIEILCDDTDMLDRFKLVRVTSRSTRYFSGHVFTLETERGYYSAASARVIARNCRCWPEPIVPEESA